MATYTLADIFASTQQLQPTQASRKVRSARSQNRAAAWAYDLAHWRAYRLAMARTDAERNEIEAEYAARLEDGPDFTGHRGQSDFAEPHLHKLAPDDKRATLAAFDAVREWSFKTRKAHGQSVSLRYREVLRFLLSMAGRFGRVYPSLATIARACSCSAKTVSNAIAWLKVWGFLNVQRRLKRVVTRLGTMVRQTSNAYAIGLSGLAAIGAAVFSKRSVRNNCRPSRIQGGQVIRFARRETDR